MQLKALILSGSSTESKKKNGRLLSFESSNPFDDNFRHNIRRIKIKNAFLYNYLFSNFCLGI